MKHGKLFLLLIAAFGLTQAGCSKNSSDLETTKPNYPPAADAGIDIYVWSPLQDAYLIGSFLDVEKDVTGVSWTRISGPDSYVFENGDSLQTRIRGLATGHYQFELTVTDKENLFDKDTVTVAVGEMPVKPNEFLFKYQVWIADWYANIEIPNFLENTLHESNFKVFIQRESDPAWLEVMPQSANVREDALYTYFVTGERSQHRPYGYGNLYVTYYGTDVSDHPHIKIVY